MKTKKRTKKYIFEYNYDKNYSDKEIKDAKETVGRVLDYIYRELILKHNS